MMPGMGPPGPPGGYMPGPFMQPMPYPPGMPPPNGQREWKLTEKLLCVKPFISFHPVAMYAPGMGQMPRMSIHVEMLSILIRLAFQIPRPTCPHPHRPANIHLHRMGPARDPLCHRPRFHHMRTHFITRVRNV
jgi:hypothetical protein